MHAAWNYYWQDHTQLQAFKMTAFQMTVSIYTLHYTEILNGRQEQKNMFAIL